MCFRTFGSTVLTAAMLTFTHVDSPQVPWPVDIVISSECQKIYNQVFLLLLQIKWAKYSLDTLRFSGMSYMSYSGPLKSASCRTFSVCKLCLFLIDFTGVTKKLEGSLTEALKIKEPINQQIHRMCLLRVKLMHFVNSLHNYITTRVRVHATHLFTADSSTALVSLMRGTMHIMINLILLFTPVLFLLWYKKMSSLLVKKVYFTFLSDLFSKHIILQVQYNHWVVHIIWKQLILTLSPQREKLPINWWPVWHVRV